MLEPELEMDMKRQTLTFFTCKRERRKSYRGDNLPNSSEKYTNKYMSHNSVPDNARWTRIHFRRVQHLCSHRTKHADSTTYFIETKGDSDDILREDGALKDSQSKIVHCV